MAVLTLHPLIHSITGKIAGTNFRRSRLGTLVVAPITARVPPSPDQLARRQAFATVPQLLPDRYPDIAASYAVHLAASDDAAQVHVLRHNLNNEATGEGFRPLPWDGALLPLDLVPGTPTSTPGTFRLAWPESPGDDTELTMFALRQEILGTGVYRPFWFPYPVQLNTRDVHRKTFLNLVPGAKYRVSGTVTTSGRILMSRSTNIDAVAYE